MAEKDTSVVSAACWRSLLCWPCSLSPGAGTQQQPDALHCAGFAGKHQRSIAMGVPLVYHLLARAGRGFGEDGSGGLVEYTLCGGSRHAAAASCNSRCSCRCSS